MTVIATDGITIAADGLAMRGSRPTATNIVKIHPRHGRIYALAGTAVMTEAVIAWHHAGADPAKRPPEVKGEFALLVIDKRGCWYYDNDFPYPDRAELPFAIGCGRDWAIAAMDFGKSPREAVAYACTRDVNCGGEIVEYDIAMTLAGMEMAPEKRVQVLYHADAAE
jgi:hypothetical protein